MSQYCQRIVLRRQDFYVKYFVKLIFSNASFILERHSSSYCSFFQDIEYLLF